MADKGNPPPKGPWKWESDDGNLGPAWDEGWADTLVGKRVLVGITYLSADKETVLSTSQFHGTIVEADRESGFVVECEGVWAGETMVLPPKCEAFEPARPGQYTLHSTNEVIEDPDFCAYWTHVPPIKH